MNKDENRVTSIRLRLRTSRCYTSWCWIKCKMLQYWHTCFPQKPHESISGWRQQMFLDLGRIYFYRSHLKMFFAGAENQRRFLQCFLVSTTWSSVDKICPFLFFFLSLFLCFCLSFPLLIFVMILLDVFLYLSLSLFVSISMNFLCFLLSLLFFCICFLLEVFLFYYIFNVSFYFLLFFLLFYYTCFLCFLICVFLLLKCLCLFSSMCLSIT